MKRAFLKISEDGQLRTPKIVLKIGGSLLDSDTLTAWLKIVAQYGDGQVIIVPGGAVFADAVRQAQQKTHISDNVAHRLALLAMDQFGLLMQGLVPDLVTASSELEIVECGWQHRGIVWLPSKMALADETIPQNWQVTSDSLSAWLANQLKAEHLILVKSKALDNYRITSNISVSQLSEDELLDAHFAKFIQQPTFKTWVINKADHAVFARGFSAQEINNHLAEKALAVSP